MSNNDESVQAFFQHTDEIEQSDEESVKDVKGVIEYVNTNVIKRLNTLEEKFENKTIELHRRDAQLIVALHDLESKMPEQIALTIDEKLEEKFKKYLTKPQTEPAITQIEQTSSNNRLSLMDIVKRSIDKDGKLNLPALLSSDMFKLDPESMKNSANSIKELISSFFEILNMFGEQWRKVTNQGSSTPIPTSEGNKIYNAYNYLVGKKIERNFLHEIKVMQKELGVQIPPDMMMESLKTAIAAADSVKHRRVG